ncbi:hypothetical protein R1flu_012026 [Riccia fluitans]|uniref:Uncharacterized protein n=1 Tax=Riccia fluitans TaxID=41844 RepID=A0ABD1ZAL9_9MARC
MYVLNMPKYITSLQRYCAHEDIFLWDIMNTNAEGDRLLLKDTRGGTNIIGRNEIAIVFGAKHKKKKDFRSIKRYKEILYYKDAAPYGPTYVVPFDDYSGRVVLVTREENTTRGGRRVGRMDTYNEGYRYELPQLLKFPKLITSLADLRQRCKLPEEIPIASPELVEYNAARKKIDCKRGSETDQPGSTKRPHAAENERGLPSTKINKETIDGLRERLAAKDAEKSNVHALARTEVQRELEEFKRSMTVKKRLPKRLISRSWPKFKLNWRSINGHPRP